MKDQRVSPEIQALCIAAGAMAGAGSFEVKVGKMLDSLLAGVNAHRGVLRLYDAREDGIRLVKMALRGIQHPPIIEIHSTKTGKTGQVFQEGRTLVEDDLISSGVAGVTTDAGLKSMVVVPVKVRGHTVGTVDISSTQLSNFTPERVKVCEAITDMLAALSDSVRPTKTAARSS